MSVHMSINRLRFELTQNRVSNIDAQIICDEVESEINSAILSIVSNAVNSAIEYAVSLEAHEFIDDVQILPDSNGLYQISTHSGTFDYSKPEQQMLNRLLSTAKTSASGNRYKVIPIEQKETRVEHSMFSMLQARQDSINTARANLLQKSRGKTNLNEAINDDLLQQTTIAKVVKEDSSVKTGKIEFRTASDQQDPSRSWVIPKKEADMTEFINELNKNITSESLQTIESIIDSYRV